MSSNWNGLTLAGMERKQLLETALVKERAEQHHAEPNVILEVLRLECNHWTH